MRTEDFRASFLAHLIDQKVQRSAPIHAILTGAGYRVLAHPHLDASLQSAQENPPHFCFLNFSDFKGQLSEEIERIRTVLPESQIFIFFERTDLHEPELADLRIHECFVNPIENPVFFIRRIDRAADLNFRIYSNEQLLKRIESLENSSKAYESSKKQLEPEEGASHSFSHLIEKLKTSQTVEGAISVFASDLFEAQLVSGLIYFKFHSPRRSLAGRFGFGVGQNDVKEIGINLNEHVPGFQVGQLKNAGNLEILSELHQQEFGLSRFESLCIECFGEVIGLLTYWGEQADDRPLQEGFSLLLQRIEFLQMQGRLHANYTLDPGTDAFNAKQIRSHLDLEVSRSRRIQVPTSLLLFRIDNFSQLQEQNGDDDVRSLLRLIVKILKRHSRSTDLVGRLEADEFALVLSHTPTQGAVIKAERTRRMIETADFAKFLPELGKLTFSLSICEYPAHCRDSEEQLELAKRVLDKISKKGNCVGLVEVAPGFEPDFRAEVGDR